MWIVIIFIVIAALIVGEWIYTKLNTKNVVEYHANGNLKMFGVTRFNERFGAFSMYNEEGKVYLKIHYQKGILVKEEFFNINNSLSPWKTIFYSSNNKRTLVDFAIADKNLRDNKELILEAVRDNGFSLEYASDQLKNDREVVETAVKQNGDALKYASDQLKNDREVVETAVKQNGDALKYASELLKNDHEIVKTALRYRHANFVYVGKKLKEDETALKSIVDSVDWLPGFRWLNKTVMFMTIKNFKDGRALFYFLGLPDKVDDFIVKSYFLIWIIVGGISFAYYDVSFKNVWALFVVITFTMYFVRNIVNFFVSFYSMKKWIKSNLK